MKQTSPSFDVVIPVSKGDVTFMYRVLAQLQRNLIGTGMDYIYILTAKSNFKQLSYTQKMGNIRLIDENSLLQGLSLNSVREYIKSQGATNLKRTGWYLQQLLKYAFAQTKYAQEYYLTWDADTLLLKPIEFFKDGHPMFTKKTEYHEPYFQTMNRLIGVGKTADYSFIAEHMMFCTKIVNELTDDIMANATLKGNTWVEKILSACNFSQNKNSLFSEFETYGTYCIVRHAGLYDTQNLNTFRYGGLVRGRNINTNLLLALKFDHHTASFELTDCKEAPFPYNITLPFDPALLIAKLRGNI